MAVLTLPQLMQRVSVLYPDNVTMMISAADLRTGLVDVIDTLAHLAQGGLTGAHIVQLLVALTGEAKLPYSALRDVPDLGLAIQQGGVLLGTGVRTINLNQHISGSIAGGVLTINGMAAGTPPSYVLNASELEPILAQVLRVAGGISRAVDDAANTITLSLTAAPAATALFIWASPSSATPTGIPAGAVSGWPSVTLPTQTADGYLYVAQAAIEPDLTKLTKPGTFHWFQGMSKGAATFTSGTTTYEYWRTNNLVFAAQLGGVYTAVR